METPPKKIISIWRDPFLVPNSLRLCATVSRSIRFCGRLWPIAQRPLRANCSLRTGSKRTTDTCKKGRKERERESGALFNVMANGQMVVEWSSALAKERSFATMAKVCKGEECVILCVWSKKERERFGAVSEKEIVIIASAYFSAARPIQFCKGAKIISITMIIIGRRNGN